MFTGTISHSGALVTAIVVLTGAAFLRGGAAVADSNQDDQFLALLDQEGIPALRGVPSLIETAHDVCRTLDAGMSAAGLVDAMVNNAVGIDPGERDYTPGRLARTEARFITAAVGAYCPYDRGKIASIRTGAVNFRSDLRGAPSARPIGEIDDPNPPQLPAPPPQAAQIQTPRLPIAAPSAPKRPPPPPQQVKPPPQQPPPPPQQMEPAGGPQPGGAGGSGGGGNAGGGNGGGSPGGNGGGVPADPSPGFVRLAP